MGWKTGPAAVKAVQQWGVGMAERTGVGRRGDTKDGEAAAERSGDGGARVGIDKNACGGAVFHAPHRRATERNWRLKKRMSSLASADLQSLTNRSGQQQAGLWHEHLEHLNICWTHPLECCVSEHCTYGTTIVHVQCNKYMYCTYSKCLLGARNKRVSYNQSVPAVHRSHFSNDRFSGFSGCCGEFRKLRN